MISREAYKILHGIDGSPDQRTIHLNWLNIKADDPRLVKVRKEIAAEHRPCRRKKPSPHKRSDSIHYDDAGILKMIKKGYTSAQIAKEYGLNRNTMYAHIKKTSILMKEHQKVVNGFKTIVVFKGEKVYATGTVSQISKKLNLKPHSVSISLDRKIKLFGYSFMRLKDWRKTHE